MFRDHAALILWICALMALGICRNLWWFAAAAVALLVGLRLARRDMGVAQGGERPRHRMLRLGTGTILSLVSYALLASVALLTVRAALGWLELPTTALERTGIAPYMKHASVGFYDKSELRLALLELLLLTVTFALVFVQSACHWVQRSGKPLVMHPMSSAFAFVLYFASIDLPPYTVHLEHWFPSIAATTGPQRPVSLAIWLSWFGLSTLSLSAAVMVGNLIAGMASFALIRRLTGSPAVALLGASYLLLQATATSAAANTCAAPAQIALSSLLLYMGLRDRTGRLWPGFLFGLTVSWDPAFGVFAAASFFLALCYQMAHTTGILRKARLQAVFAVLAGIGLSILIVGVARGVLGSIPTGFNAEVILENAFSRFHFDNLAQRFEPLFLPLWIPGLLYLALVLRRLRRSRRLTARYLFAGASLVSAIPCAFLAPGQFDPSLSVYWVLMPAVGCVIYGFVRLLALRSQSCGLRRARAASSIRLTAMILCVLFDILFPIDRLNQVVAKYATGYETERQKWYMECASGQACDPDQKPSLMNHLRRASQPLSGAGWTKHDPI